MCTYLALEIALPTTYANIRFLAIFAQLFLCTYYVNVLSSAVDKAICNKIYLSKLTFQRPFVSICFEGCL